MDDFRLDVDNPVITKKHGQINKPTKKKCYTIFDFMENSKTFAHIFELME